MGLQVRFLCSTIYCFGFCCIAECLVVKLCRAMCMCCYNCASNAPSATIAAAGTTMGMYSQTL